MNTLSIKQLKQKFWDSLVLSKNGYFDKKISLLSQRSQCLKMEKYLDHAGVPNASMIFTYTNLNELKALYELAVRCPQKSVVLEIGSHLGASSCYLAAGLKHNDGHLFCVDTWGNETMPEGEQDTFLEFQRNTKGVEQQITPIRKWSAELNENDFDGLLNLVFIDGDHSYQAVKQDFELVQQWLAEDGVIAFHDFSNDDYEGVTRVVGEALISGKWVLEGKVDTLAWIKPARWRNSTWV